MRDRLHDFEEAAVPHLPAAYNLARWLTRNDKDAEDVVQDAYLRAFTYFDRFRGGDIRPWLLAIVRNTCHTWIRRNRVDRQEITLDMDLYDKPQESDSPELALIKEVDHELLMNALEKLPAEFRELIVLREFEELSYKQIADVVKVPIGTVMSRLSRARKRLELILTNHCSPELVEVARS
jgi:RNA polymerase sigma-70 factor (ECF subfamily)